jgi:hypothetical protein
MKFVPKFQPSSNPLGIVLEFWNRAVYWTKIPTLFQRKTSKKSVPEEFFCSQLRKNAKKYLEKLKKA